MNGWPCLVIKRPFPLIGWHSLAIGIEWSSLEVERPSVVVEVGRPSIVVEWPSLVGVNERAPLMDVHPVLVFERPSLAIECPPAPSWG